MFYIFINDLLSLIVKTSEFMQAFRFSHSIRCAAVHRKVTYYTTMPAALATTYALDHMEDSSVNRLKDLHAGVVS